MDAITSANPMTPEQAAQVLGVEIPATPEQLRAAYLRNVQAHPPDRDPQQFEQIRDAYDQLRNPAVVAQAVLAGPPPDAPLTTLLDNLPPGRKYAPVELWAALLKEKRA